jgi:D-alanyl-D-alanine carboxypeptidase
MNPSVSRKFKAAALVAAITLVSSLVLPLVAEAQTNKRAAPSRGTPARQTVHAPAPWVPNPAVSARDSYLIVDAASGRDLADDRSDEPRHPASLTKLMTIYMTFSYLDSGKLALGDVLPVSANAANVSPTKMGVPMGGTVTVRDAVMGLVTRSANDAAVVLAEAMSGDEASFAKAMTWKAKNLGMTSTLFKNASGLPDREQVTTARDMARLAHALLRDFPHYYPIFSVQTSPYRGRPLENHNRMLTTYAGADGFKTGYTNASGYNLVMSAMRDGRRLIGVVMGGNTAYTRDKMMAELMDVSFAGAGRSGVAAWHPTPPPTAARYNAAHFAPNAVIPEPQPARAPTNMVASVGTPLAMPASAALPTPTFTNPAKPDPAALVPLRPTVSAASPTDTLPDIGSWVIQVGSFGDSRAALQALDRASSALPPAIKTRAAASVDELQMAQKTFHRARLTNLSQEEAMEGCKKLEQRKIYCSAIQVTAWNTPNAR